MEPREKARQYWLFWLPAARKAELPKEGMPVCMVCVICPLNTAWEIQAE